MKQNILILHKALKHIDEIFADCRLRMAEPHIVHTLDEALERLKRYPYTLIVVEVTPPWRSTAEPVVILRAITTIPILALLRGHDSESFRYCLDVANACVWEPFTSEEIIARGTALIEKSVFDTVPQTAVDSVYCRGLMILPQFYKIYVGDDRVHLARKEYATLLYLAQNRERLLTCEQIYIHVWEEDRLYNVENAVSGQIHGIRRKLSKYTREEYIETVWGIGYRFLWYVA